MGMQVSQLDYSDNCVALDIAMLTQVSDNNFFAYSHTHWLLFLADQIARENWLFARVYKCAIAVQQQHLAREPFFCIKLRKYAHFNWSSFFSGTTCKRRFVAQWSFLSSCATHLEKALNRPDWRSKQSNKKQVRNHLSSHNPPLPPGFNSSPRPPFSKT